MPTETISSPVQRTVSSGVSAFIMQVYMWMVAGLGLTAFVGLILSNIFTNNIELAEKVYAFALPLFIVELLIVIALSARAGKMNYMTSVVLFLVYAAINGLTFSFVFATVSPGVIAVTFGATTLTFGAMAAYGYFTSQDLSKFGNIAIMLLIGLLVATLVNIFAQSDGLSWIITYLGIGIFVVLTAWDTQKLKKIYAESEQAGIPASKFAINGALQLYLDFINLFYYLLRIFNSRN
jgi:FtsH-binding integral membrane protein